MVNFLSGLDFWKPQATSSEGPKEAVLAKPPEIDVSATARRLWNTAKHFLEGVVGSGATCAPLPEDAQKRLCEAAIDILTNESNIRDVAAPVTIVGDIHGQYLDLLQIFETMGRAPEKNYVFLGDYVDRGGQSVETIQLLVALKVRFPSQVTLLRGNHECRSVTQVFGFYDEVLYKYNSVSVWTYYTDLFDYLPLGCIIDNKIFCTHGGLSPEVDTMDDIQLIDRFREVPHDGPICDLLWSDPSEESGWGMSSRGAGYLFGPDVTEKFLHENGLDLLCRAHQLVLDGYSWAHDKKVVTLFSAPNYCGRAWNQGAAMTVSKDMEFGFRQFSGCLYPSAGDMERQMLNDALSDNSPSWQDSPRGAPPPSYLDGGGPRTAPKLTSL